jgi:hypothetical protein
MKSIRQRTGGRAAEQQVRQWTSQEAMGKSSWVTCVEGHTQGKWACELGHGHGRGQGRWSEMGVPLQKHPVTAKTNGQWRDDGTTTTWIGRRFRWMHVSSPRYVLFFSSLDYINAFKLCLLTTATTMMTGIREMRAGATIFLIIFFLQSILPTTATTRVGIRETRASVCFFIRF